MSHTVSVEGTWGVSTVECRPDEVLLDALIRHQVPVAFCCKAGLCGMCKTELTSGEIHHLPSSSRALSSEEASRGWILTCCAKPASSCSLRPLNTLQSVDASNMGVLSTLEAIAVSSSGLSGGRSLLRLRSDTAEGFTRFRAGHWARLFDLDRRSVSYLGCFVDQAPDGRALFSVATAAAEGRQQVGMRVGERAYVDGPKGVAFDMRAFDEPAVLVLDEHGLPLLDGLARLRASALEPLMPLMAVISERPVEQALIQSPSTAWLTRRLLCFKSFHEAEDGVRQELSLLAQETAETGRRMKLLLRGAPAFQGRMRKVAAGTGVRAWDISTEYLLNLTETTETLETKNDQSA